MDIELKIFEFLKEKLKNVDLTLQHAEETAENAYCWATMLGANSRICKYAGLLHDVGYTGKHEEDKTRHRIVGADMSRTLLTNLGEEKDIIERTADCILTHDGNLKLDSPLENRIVNDADALVFLKSPEWGLKLFKRMGLYEKEAKEKLIKHAHFSYDIIVIPEIKEIGKFYYVNYLKKM